MFYTSRFNLHTATSKLQSYMETMGILQWLL